MITKDENERIAEVTLIEEHISFVGSLSCDADCIWTDTKVLPFTKQLDEKDENDPLHFYTDIVDLMRFAIGRFTIDVKENSIESAETVTGIEPLLKGPDTFAFPKS